MRPLLLAFTIPFLCQCSSLPKPGQAAVIPQFQKSAKVILEQSAATQGNTWKTYRNVQLTLDGEWASLVDRLQPELVDKSFRKRSVETYNTQKPSVRQVFTGPAGTKVVERNSKGVSVTYNGQPTQAPQQLAASALVADAYTIFAFGPSWLYYNSKNLQVLPPSAIGAKRCHRVQGTFQPGLGFASQDQFIAWVEEESNLLRRVQFTLNGTESTQGADVETTFSNYYTAPDGTIWPTQFVENIVRPIRKKAHEWRTLKIVADGRTLLQTAE